MSTCKKWMRSLYKKPLKKCVSEKGRLRKLQEDLSQVLRMNPFDGILLFFTALHFWQDRKIKNLILELEEVNYGQFHQTIKNLKVLQGFLIDVEQNKNVFQPKGIELEKIPTPETIFIKGNSGMGIQTLRFWKEKRNEYEQSNAFGKDISQSASREISRFVRENARPIIAVLNQIIPPK
ncbi:MAG: hypothetical protein IPN70_04220 [Candidatus Moraniibacteriota bacterium]|nr:MAG: hypothetical protein IPN70_04220 [Candidatus Moranbacteria bacterium]